MDGSGNAYVIGYTSSTDFPTTGGFDTSFNGAFDAFVTRVSPATVLTIAKTDAADPVAPGANLTYTISYVNTEANATGAVITDTVPENTTFASATRSGTHATGVVTWGLGEVAAGGSGSVELVVAVANPLEDGTVISNSTYGIDSTETAATTGAAVMTTVSSPVTATATGMRAPGAPVGAAGRVPRPRWG